LQLLCRYVNRRGKVRGERRTDHGRKDKQQEVLRTGEGCGMTGAYYGPRKGGGATLLRRHHGSLTSHMVERYRGSE